MLDYARDCLAARNLSGLMQAAPKLSQKKILDVLESALRSKKEWAWPHLINLIEPQFKTSILWLASVHSHKHCFDQVFATVDWSGVTTEIWHDAIIRCANHNDSHGFFKLAAVRSVDICSNIAYIAVRRNNEQILECILAHNTLSSDEQKTAVVAAIEMEHERCLDILLPHIDRVAFDDRDIRTMMHHVGAPADLMDKIAKHFTAENFDSILRCACMDGNKDVLNWVFPYAKNPAKVLQFLEGGAAQLLQERMDQAQKDRLLRRIKTKPTASAVRKM